jgi:hypothetical protein
MTSTLRQSQLVFDRQLSLDQLVVVFVPQTAFDATMSAASSPACPSHFDKRSLARTE